MVKIQQAVYAIEIVRHLIAAANVEDEMSHTGRIASLGAMTFHGGALFNSEHVTEETTLADMLAEYMKLDNGDEAEESFTATARNSGRCRIGPVDVLNDCILDFGHDSRIAFDDGETVYEVSLDESEGIIVGSTAALSVEPRVSNQVKVVKR